MHGEGTLYQKDGSYYSGSFSSGQMNGHGKQVTVVGGVETEVYEGSFLRGQRHNEGLDHRVGKSDTRLWYNHGRLLRRQASPCSARLRGIHSHASAGVVQAAPPPRSHCHSFHLIEAESTPWRQPQVPSRLISTRSSLRFFTPPAPQAACLHLSLHSHARCNRRLRH